MKIINFFKDQWFFVLFIIVLLMMQYESDKTIKKYEVQLKS